MKFKEFILKIMGEPVNKPEETEALTLRDALETEDLTLRDAFTAYIWDCRKNKTFAESTIDSYEVVRDKHLQFIIDADIFTLDQHLVQVALDNEISKGLSVSTVKKYKSVLLRIFEAYRPEFKPNLVVRK